MFFVRNLSKLARDISLKGRNYLVPNDLTPDEMKSILFTAIDLKNGEISDFQAMAGRNITMLLNQPCLRMQTCLHNTANMLKMSLNILIFSDWTDCQNPQDAGKILSSVTDIIFCQSPKHSKIERFAKGSTVPVINISSCKFISLNILSDLLTLQQHFGELNGLTLAWIGKPCPQLNTYLSLTPLLGLRMKFFCQCGGPVSPSNINFLRNHNNLYRERLIECTGMNEAIAGAQVIMTNQHSEKALTLKKNILDTYADKRWVFLHNLPRSSIEVEEEVFESEKNLLWKSFVNTKWICATIISKFLA